jgi:hypothetical protein
VPLGAEGGLSHVSAAYRTRTSEKSYCLSFRWAGVLLISSRPASGNALIWWRSRCGDRCAELGFGQPNVKFLSQEAQRPPIVERRHAGLNTRLVHLGAACSNSA